MSNFFRRVEKKYIINRKEYLILKKIMEEKMVEDEHGKSTICNIYLDTDNFDLVKHSITKPAFKDKVRLRSYNIPKFDTKVFLEVKRKYDGVVSKRRIELKLKDFYNYINNNNKIEDSQIKQELDYYFEYYNLKPKMYVSYNRVAYYDKQDRDFRITFDSNILARDYDLNLENGNYGENVLNENQYIMEVKTLGAIPMWFVRVLNEYKIYPGSFSKYGEAYTKFIIQNDHAEKYKQVV